MCKAVDFFGQHFLVIVLPRPDFGGNSGGEMNGYQRWMAITVSILQKKFLRSVDPKQPKNVKFSLWSIIETFPRGCMTFQGRCAPFFHSLRCRKGAHVEAKFLPYTQQNPITTHTNTTTLFRFAIQLRSSSLFTKGAVYKYDISMTLGGILDLFKKILLLSVSWQSILTMGM